MQNPEVAQVNSQNTTHSNDSHYREPLEWMGGENGWISSEARKEENHEEHLHHQFRISLQLHSLSGINFICLQCDSHKWSGLSLHPEYCRMNQCCNSWIRKGHSRPPLGWVESGQPCRHPFLNLLSPHASFSVWVGGNRKGIFFCFLISLVSQHALFSVWVENRTGVFFCFFFIRHISSAGLE